MTIEELFGTLQQSVVDSWREHLKTSKYSAHIALNEFYDEMPELVDDIIEHYIGVFGKPGEYTSILSAKGLEPVDYLKKLRNICKTGRVMLKKETELESDMDAILAQIDSTIYKLENLTESRGPRSLKDFLIESMQVNEAGIYNAPNDLKKAVEYAISEYEDQNGGSGDDGELTPKERKFLEKAFTEWYKEFGTKCEFTTNYPDKNIEDLTLETSRPHLNSHYKFNGRKWVEC